MKAIVVVDETWGIGRDNQLLFSIPEDMAFFRRETAGKTVVMGRRTLESLPGGRPLKNRVNIVLTQNPDFACEGTVICHSGTELAAALQDTPPAEIYLIGGALVYRRFLPCCTEALVTKVLADGHAGCDFPNLDADDRWALAEQSELRTHEGLSYRFCRYVNQSPAPFPA